MCAAAVLRSDASPHRLTRVDVRIELLAQKGRVILESERHVSRSNLAVKHLRRHIGWRLNVNMQVIQRLFPLVNHLAFMNVRKPLDCDLVHLCACVLAELVTEGVSSIDESFLHFTLTLTDSGHKSNTIFTQVYKHIYIWVKCRICTASHYTSAHVLTS